MLRLPFFLLLFAAPLCTLAQKNANPLTVEKIMRKPTWIGTSPSDLHWSEDGQSLYFNWNPETAPADSTYYIKLDNRVPVKASAAQTQALNTTGSFAYNFLRTAYVFSKDGDIFYVEIKTGKTKRITQTTDSESNPSFSFNDTKIVYTRNQNLFAWDISSGETLQLTNLKIADLSSGNPAAPAPISAGGFGRSNRDNNTRNNSNTNKQEDWLKNDQLKLFEVLRSRKNSREKEETYNKSLPKTKELRSINIEDKSLQGLSISPDGRFITYRLSSIVTSNKNTIVPSYVTESGFTTDINGRTKVGTLQSAAELYIYDRERDTVVLIRTDSLPGIRDLPDYVKDYPAQLEERSKNNAARMVAVAGFLWSPKGAYAIADIRSRDNKDRWLLLWDTATRKLSLLDRQRDEAWIGGPGIGFGRNMGWIDDSSIWFQSELTGYSHLYTMNVNSKQKTALTEGKYEVQQAQLSRDKKFFYIITNEVHPGEQQFYRLSIADKKQVRITTMTGANQVTISPDEKYLGILYSYSTRPWELYLQENKPGGKIEQVTNKAQSDEFKTFTFRDPEVISFTASDGALVYARIYKPANPHPNKPAVLFVHGAGYLQNAHKWWSSYYREYMFNNLLADNGYYVMDIDYRGSSGYGRDWRTGIYRHMGGKDLDDNVDAANYLVKTYGVNPNHIGLYGGSYGGFLSLMAMFTKPGVFAAGAALRPVTDWANYNHGYTSNILNEPYNDSLAYHRSSPIYFAEGLQGHLLICHGMLDVNVHFQDAVKLSQRLIELGKNNWELAPFPMEDHDFAEPSSWTDEYKRIYKLFEAVLKK